jgi:hypothetical protein
LSAAAPLTFSRLVHHSIWSFNADGSVMDLAAPSQQSVCFLEIGSTLSKLSRFNGRNAGMSYSVAQHLVMGTQAVINEGGSSLDAALFLLHDGHEWALGDLVRPAEKLYAGMCMQGEVSGAIEAAKAGWDAAIYAAANLPMPEFWTRAQRLVVKNMDDRMCAAEAVALFGPRASSQFPKFHPPKTTGAIRPWPAMKAEEEFHKMALRLIGEDRINSQVAIAAAARARR